MRTFTSLNPSSGGIGSILNTANAILIMVNNIQKLMTKLEDPSMSSVRLIFAVFAKIKIIRIPMIDIAILLAGPASATISSSFSGFL